MNRIAGFDGIRALAAISVVLTHLHIFKFVQDNGWVHASIISSIDGSAGVQAFFVLSGFLITKLLMLESRECGHVSLYNFYVRRTLRIFPLYFLVVFLIFLLHLIGEGVTNYKSLIFAGAYSYNFIPKDWYSGVLGHTWSLAVEEHFYLIWPFCFISFATKLKKLMLFTLAFILLSFISALVLTDIAWLDQNYFIGRWTFIAGANIAMGAILALTFDDEKLGPRIINLLRNRTSLIVILLIIFNQVFTGGIYDVTSKYLRGIGFTLLIGWVYVNQSNKLVKLLEIPPLRYLGNVSYGIYMYQGFFLATGPFRAAEQSWPPEQYIGIVLLILAVPLSYKYFEVPIMKLKYRYQNNVNKDAKQTVKKASSSLTD